MCDESNGRVYKNFVNYNKYVPDKNFRYSSHLEWMYSWGI